MVKKITIIISSLAGGGAEKVSVTLANQLAENKYEINFVVLNLKNSKFQDLLNKEINLINLDVNHARTSIFALNKYFNNYKPQNILVFNHEIAIVVLILRFFLFRKWKNVNIISRNINTLSENKNHEPSIWHNFFKEFFIKYIYKYSDKIISQSKMMKDDLIENYNVSPEKITIINNPLNQEIELAYKTIDHSTIKKNEIIFVGRLEKQKGLTYLFESFKLVLQEEPDLKLIIIGEGSLYKELVNYSKKLGIEQNIIFHGFEKQIDFHFKNAKLTVLTSLFEGFPNVLVESIFLGTPVVSFDCKSGPSEIIEEGVNGFLVEYLNIAEMAEKILKALKYEWNREEIRKTAEKYKVENIVKNYLEVIYS